MMDMQQLPRPLPLDDNPRDKSTPESGSGASDEEGSNDEVIDGDEEEDDEDVVIVYEEEEDDGKPRKKWVQTPSEPLVWYPQDKEGQDKFKRYYEIIKESEGFDVGEGVPPVDAMIHGVLPVNLESPIRGNDVKNGVAGVIREHNDAKKGVSELQLVKIVKANYGPCSGENLFITFEATGLLSSNHANTTTYEARVHRDIRGNLSTTFLREKGQKRVLIGESGGYLI